MKKNMFNYFFLCLLIQSLWVSQTLAETFTSFQGDVLRLTAPENASEDLSIKVFGQTWPIYRHQGKQVAWVGIHLKTKPETYDITWTSNNKTADFQTWHEQVIVKKGEFRISHITVKKSMSSFDNAAIKRIIADQNAIKKTYTTPTNIKSTWPEMVWPVQGIVSTPFAAQRYVNGKPKSPHSGLDIAAPTGTLVVAPLAGEVLLVSDMFLNGTLVSIGHGDGLTTVYAHLNKAFVKEGDILKQGDTFAEVGSTGRSTGPHLHWGVHFAGAKVNPKALLNQKVQ